MLDFTQYDWIDLTKLTRYHQNLMSFLSENYLNKSGGTMNGQINSCSILPKSPSSYNLGSSTNQWSNIYSNGFVLVDSTGQIRPNSTGTGNIGTSSYYWGNAYINNIYGIAIYQNGNQVWDKSNLQVGGRNLMLGTKDFSGTWVTGGAGNGNRSNWTKDSNTYNGLTVYKREDPWQGLNKTTIVEAGKTYTFSVYIKGTDVVSTDNVRIYISSSSSGAASISGGSSENLMPSINSDFKRFSYTFQCTVSGGVRCRIEKSTSTGTIYICGYKLEEGNTPTTWTPAPEDTDALITTAQNKADSAYSNNQATQTQLDNLQVGGRNLARNTATITDGTTSGNYVLTQYGIDLINNGDVTLTMSCRVKGNELALSGSRRIGLSFFVNKIGGGTAYYEVWKKFSDSNPYTFNEIISKTFIIPKNYLQQFTGKAVNTYVQTRISGTYSISEIKLECGNTPTTWTPAPEDVDADISTAQTTANTAVSNAATAQSGVNTLNEIVMPNGEIFSLTADNFNTDTTILDDDIGFQNSLQNAYASNPVTLKLDKEQGCYIEFVQDETNSKFQSMEEILNHSNNRFLTAKASDLNTNGYTIWTRVRLRDLIVHSSTDEFANGIFCLGSYSNSGFSFWRNEGLCVTINGLATDGNNGRIFFSISDYVNKWIDICFTADSVNAETRYIKLYLNGVLTTSKTSSIQINPNNAAGINIGRGGNRSHSGFTNMDFKAAKVWNRPLTAGEVAGLTKYFNSTGSATAKNINNAQSMANNALPKSGGTMTGTINSQNILPKTTETYNLGSGSYKWNNAYIKYLNCSTFLTSQSGNEYFNINATGSDSSTCTKYSFITRRLSLFDSNACVYMQPFDDTGAYKGFSVTLNSKNSTYPNDVYKGRTSISLYTNESLSNPGAYLKFDVGNNSNVSSFTTYVFSHCSYSNCLIFQGSLIPVSTNNYDIGSDTYSLRWRYVYAKQGYATNGWSTSCDEKLKRDIKDVNVLDKLKSLRVKKFKYSQKAIKEKQWNEEEDKKMFSELSKGNRNYKRPETPKFEDDENSPDYIMAMAGEFNKAFGLDGDNEDTINYTNAIGVALRAIQELSEQVDELKRKLNEKNKK